MTKIAEVVRIYPGMSNTVNLKTEFYDKVKNKARMEGYKPIKAHREIILTLVKAFQPNNGFKSSLLTGHYGTGKSHLLLMLANIFSQTPDQPELKTFFKAFEEADSELAKQVKNISGNGRYLVVIPDYSSTADFSEAVITALEESLEKEDFKSDLSTIYKEAIRYLVTIKEAEEKGTSPLYSTFLNVLEHEPIDFKGYSQIIAALQNNRKEALDLFKRIIKQITFNDFRYNASNINIILEDLIKSNEFSLRFDGVVIMYDEFDYVLKNKRISVEVVQGFAELCKSSNKIIFIGAMHKQLSAYANEYSVEDFRVVSARFKPIDVRTEGLEELVSAIVQIDENEIYNSIVKPQLPQLYSKITDIKRLDLFKWLDEKEIQEKIIKAVYPLHPLSMSCLLSLSTAIGSSNRTLFTFLGGEGDGAENKYSYKNFINEHEIINTDQLLNLFTTDYLVDYFNQELDVNNIDLTPSSKDSVRAYAASYKELQNINADQGFFNPKDFNIDNTIYIKILKIMLVFDIVGIKCEIKNIVFALNIQTRDQIKVTNALKLLSKYKVIFHNSIADSYEFRKGTEIDWSEFISIEKEKLIASGNIPIDSEFISIASEFDNTFDTYLNATAFNSTINSDFRLLRVIELFKNFGKSKLVDGIMVEYFKYHQQIILNQIGKKDGIDGIVIYVIIESDDDISKARIFAKENNSKYILCVIPENPIPISDEFISFRAALNIKHSNDYSSSNSSDQARLDESFIGGLNSGYTKQYIDLRNKYLSGKMSTWYGNVGQIIENRPTSDQDPIKKFLKNLYTRFNIISDEELNRKHKNLTGNKESIFKEAVECLLVSGQIIEIDKKYGSDKGFIRYLYNILYAKQILVNSSKSSQDPKIMLCETQKDINKYELVFPALADMIKEVQSVNSLNLKKFIQKYKEAPYGLSNVTLKFFIAYISNYFGDELEYKKTSNDTGEVLISNYNIVSAIVDSDNSLSVFNKRKLTDVEKIYLREIYNVFSTDKLSVSEFPTLSDTSNKLSNWWSRMNKLSKSDDFFTVPKTKTFIQVFNSISHFTFYEFFFAKTLTISDFPEDAKLDNNITKQLIDDINVCKYEIENILTKVENQLLEKLLKAFNADGNTDEDLKNMIIEWYNSLDENQKDETASWQVKTSIALLRSFKSLSVITTTIYNRLPIQLDLGPVKEWTTNEIDTYTSKVHQGISILNNQKITVQVPIVEAKNDGFEKIENKSEITFKFEDKDKFILVIKPPLRGITVYMTDNSQDPQSSGSQRTKIKNDFEYKTKNTYQVIKIVSQDSENKYSKTLSITLKENSDDCINETITGYITDKPMDVNHAKRIIKGLVGKFLSSGKMISKKDLGNFLIDFGKKLENEA